MYNDEGQDTLKCSNAPSFEGIAELLNIIIVASINVYVSDHHLHCFLHLQRKSYYRSPNPCGVMFTLNSELCWSMSHRSGHDDHKCYMLSELTKDVYV